MKPKLEVIAPFGGDKGFSLAHILFVYPSPATLLQANAKETIRSTCDSTRPDGGCRRLIFAFVRRRLRSQ